MTLPVRIPGAALAVCLLLAACSNPRDVVIPPDVAQVSTISESIQKLEPEEKDLVGRYIMRHTLGSAMGGLFGVKETPIPPGTTIGEAIKEQRSFEEQARTKAAQEAALKEQIRAQRDKAIEAMRSAVTVTVVSKGIVTETGYGGIEMDRKLAVVFGFKNNTEKALAGVKGTLNIHDLFDDELCGFAISYDTTIPPGGTATWTGGRSVRFGLNAANDQKFADLKDDKYKAVWIPDMVVFEDGTKMVGPDE